MTDYEYILTSIKVFEPEEAAERIANYLRKKEEIAKSRALTEYIDKKIKSL